MKVDIIDIQINKTDLYCILWTGRTRFNQNAYVNSAIAAVEHPLF